MMKDSSPSLAVDVTQSLNAWRLGNQQALAEVMPRIYGRLRRQAASYLQHERRDHTLQPTALVHEAFLRLHQQRPGNWQSRAHFYAIAATLMRRVLVDHARSRCMIKRGQGNETQCLDAARYLPSLETLPVEDLMALDDALRRLTELDAQQGRLVELRFFGGLSVEETAEALGVSGRTVKRRWQTAKLWLYRELHRPGPHGG